MFESLPMVRDVSVGITVDGQPHRVAAEFSVAAAMLSLGLPVCRYSAVGNQARGPFCMMGTCFDCLVDIDGVSNQQGCMVTVREGMHIRAMRGKPELR